MKGERQREGETESQAGSAPSTQSLAWDLNSQTVEIMTWAKTKIQMPNQLSHPGVPKITKKKKITISYHRIS